MIQDIYEREYCQSIPLEHRKKYAQFFTPYAIADFMAKWILGNRDCKTILDPAFGLGIFARAILLNTSKDLKITGFDIDKLILEKAHQICSDLRVSLHHQDYIFSNWDHSYDGIICNPPYFKFHDYDNHIILKEIEQKLIINLTRFTNLYPLFLLKSSYQLNPGGRGAYLVPSEFMNADYGKKVKQYLLKDGKLKHIIIIDFKEDLFNDAITTSAILLLANDHQSDSIEFITIKSLSELEQLQTKLLNYPVPTNLGENLKYREIDPLMKWRLYYQGQNSLKYNNLVPFSKYGKIVRGIATGDNKYFGFNLQKQRHYQIKSKYLLPCIIKANDAPLPFFTPAHFEELKAKDKNVFLLNATDLRDDHLNKYIRFGEQQNVNKKHLTSHRKPWYSLENRPPAPIWVSVFNRNGLRFVRNEAKISNLTAFHCVYLNLLSESKIDVLFAYLLTDVAREIFNDNKREYGQGLDKFEPNDLNHAYVINLDYIDLAEENKIIDILATYRQGVLAKKPNPHLLEELDQIFRVILSAIL